MYYFSATLPADVLAISCFNPWEVRVLIFGDIDSDYPIKIWMDNLDLGSVDPDPKSDPHIFPMQREN